jgi:ABC-type dipeptide/oligopeptide/nickel transport system ATPase component
MVYVTGPSGTGKSVMISSLLRAIKEPRAIDPVNIIFSAQTDSFVTQMMIESRLMKNISISMEQSPA